MQLRLDTHNPTALTPGDSFWGSEIVTRRIFAVGPGLSFSARVRIPEPRSRGLVASMFGYALTGAVRDELDFELLTNDSDRVLTNLYKAQGFNGPGRPVYVSGVDATQFNDFTVNWYPDRVQWIVNGRLVREVNDDVPTEPMTIRLNFWAPGPDFHDAFDATLRPISRAEVNQTFLYEVDFVEVRRF